MRRMWNSIGVWHFDVKHYVYVCSLCVQQAHEYSHFHFIGAFCMSQTHSLDGSSRRPSKSVNTLLSREFICCDATNQRKDAWETSLGNLYARLMISWTALFGMCEQLEGKRIEWAVLFVLQARIAFLQGERKGQENLKNDLVRRIKMLEYALKQER